MTRSAFLQRLGRTTWQIEESGAIVLTIHTSVCPAMYVCGKRLEWTFEIAGVDRRVIFASADNRVESPYFDLEWRRDLLQACGLAGEA